MRKRLIIGSLVLGAWLLIGFVYFSVGSGETVVYEGQSIQYWANELDIAIGRGRNKYEAEIMAKMDEKAVPFWLSQLRKPDSRRYTRFWYSSPQIVQDTFPRPHRRNVAHVALGGLHYTNAIPELIELSYSKDPELQYYAVTILWKYGFHFYHPSDACIKAFCHALKAEQVQTRLMALRGLCILPLRREALPSLYGALRDPDEEVRIEAAALIVKMEPKQDLKSFFQAGIKSTNESVWSISWRQLNPGLPLPQPTATVSRRELFPAW